MRGEVGSIGSCEEEWRRLSSDHVAAIVVDDVDVHHTRWLRHSSGVSVKGTSLYKLFSANGLKQCVKRPTRKDGHLSNLVISDLAPRSVKISHPIADHNIVLASFHISIPEATLVIRKAFDYGMADWANRKRDLAAFDLCFVYKSINAGHLNHLNT